MKMNFKVFIVLLVLYFCSYCTRLVECGPDLESDDSLDLSLANEESLESFRREERHPSFISDGTTRGKRIITRIITTERGPREVKDCWDGAHFDGPSFIGGIVLALGIIGIIYLAFKFFCKTRRSS